MKALPNNYLHTLAHLKERISSARIKAALAANREIIRLYWEIGSSILQMQENHGWGAKVIDRLSADLRADFPDLKGLSVRNLKYMAHFARRFPHFGQQAAAHTQYAENDAVIIGQQAAAQLSETTRNGMEAKRLNEWLKPNKHRLLQGFMCQISQQDWYELNFRNDANRQQVNSVSFLTSEAVSSIYCYWNSTQPLNG